MKLIILFVVALFFPVFGVYGQALDIPENAKLVEEKNGVQRYVEANGIDYWERYEDGTIIEYYPNGEVKQRITPRETIFYNDAGVIIYHKKEDGEYFYDNEGVLENFIEGDSITTYREGEVVRKESTSTKEVFFDATGEMEFVVYNEKKVYIKRGTGGMVLSIRHPIAFNYEYSVSRVGEGIVEATVKKGEVRNGLGAFLARVFSKEITLEEIDRLYTGIVEE